MGSDGFAGVTEFFGDFKPCGLIGFSIRRGSSPYRGRRSTDLRVAVVGVAMTQAVAGEAVGAGDAAGT